MICTNNKNNYDNLKLSIITICLNEKNIEDTCKSIISQKFRNYEWIVVDGGSTDGTIDIIHKYIKFINILISEKDDGRYFAMNKGIEHALGEYILFLNGGDYLAHEFVLENIFCYKPITGLESISLNLQNDILHGEVSLKENGMMPWPHWKIGPQTIDLNYFSDFHSLPHQATFIKRELFMKYGLYNTNYIYASDYEWFLRVIIKYGASTSYLPIIVSVYNFEGISSRSIDKLPLKEAQQIFAFYQKKYIKILIFIVKLFMPYILILILRPVWINIKKILYIIS